MIQTFTIEQSLCDLNTYINAERSNRYMAAKIKREEMEKVCWAIKVAKLKKIKKAMFMEYRWYCKDKRKDKDNISSFGRKVIQDALVKMEILPSDGWDFIVDYCDIFLIDGPAKVEVEIHS